jgi:hypothetical protein
LTRCSCHRPRRGLSASFVLRSNRKPEYSLAFVIDLSPVRASQPARVAENGEGAPKFACPTRRARSSGMRPQQSRCLIPPGICLLSCGWPASTWHRDQAMRVCGSGDVRRRRLPCRSDKAVYWRAALPLGHATTFAAARWRRAHRGPRRGTSSCRPARNLSADGTRRLLLI